MYTKLNDFIEENDCDEDSEMTLGDLDDVLNTCFNNRLVFDKEWEVQVEYSTMATFTIRAKNQEEAEQEAETMGWGEQEFDQEADDVVTEFIRIGYSQRKER
jgi:hypothetical protein